MITAVFEESGFDLVNKTTLTYKSTEHQHKLFTFFVGAEVLLLQKIFTFKILAISFPHHLSSDVRLELATQLHTGSTLLRTQDMASDTWSYNTVIASELVPLSIRKMI